MTVATVTPPPLPSKFRAAYEITPDLSLIFSLGIDIF